MVETGPEKYPMSMVSIHFEMVAVRVANQIQQKMSRLKVNSVVEQVQFKVGLLSERKIFSVSWCPCKQQSADCMMMWTKPVLNLPSVFQSDRTGKGDDQ